MNKKNRLLDKFGSSIAESLGQRSNVVEKRGTTEVDPSAGRKRAKGYFEIDINLIDTETQIRQYFDQEKLHELAQSIKQHGIESPIIVRWDAGRAKNVIVAGERRFRAAKIAGLKAIPCFVKPANISAAELLETQIVENLQREDLNAIEEAKAFRAYMDTTGSTAQSLAKKIGKHQTTITRSLRFLRLPEDIQHDIAVGKIPKSVAREAARLKDEKAIRTVLKQASENGMKVSDVAGCVATKSTTFRSNRPKPISKLSFETENGIEVKVRIDKFTPRQAIGYADVKQALVDSLTEVDHRIRNGARLNT